jgi:uncharacterized protein (TIGR03435 family)
MVPRFSGIAIFIAGLSASLGQAPTAAPSFEVASVRRADPDRRMSITRVANRLTFSNYSLEILILWAYDIRSERLLGKPRGLDSARFDIVAIIPDEAPAPGRLNLMMRSLLADRFKLVAHSETRELHYYAMVVDKNGPKVRVEALTGPPGQNPFDMSARGHLTGAKVSADMLAKVLTDALGRFVEDETGLKGVFDFRLDWADTDSGSNGPDGPASSTEPRSGASIFTAMQEQLGLRLEARKGKVEVVVIGHVENTPSEN